MKDSTEPNQLFFILKGVINNMVNKHFTAKYISLLQTQSKQTYVFYFFDTHKHANLFPF